MIRSVMDFALDDQTELLQRTVREFAESRVATADDIAHAVVVLASDELSGHVIGELVTVADGMEWRTVHS